MVSIPTPTSATLSCLSPGARGELSRLVDQVLELSWSQQTQLLSLVVTSTKYIIIRVANLTWSFVRSLGQLLQKSTVGCGVLVREDGSHFEGELSHDGAMNGPGVLRFSHGDVLEGNFLGQWTDGVKVSGVLRPHHTPPSLHRCVKKYWQQTDNKWRSAFDHCRQQLGMTKIKDPSQHKVWECLGSALQAEREAVQYFQRPCDGLDGLEIPPIAHSDNCLNWENYCTIKNYLHTAFACPLHPLGRLVGCLEDAFTDSYQEEVSHKLLLNAAVEELKSFNQRLYQIVLALFPILPEEGDLVDLQVNHTNTNTQTQSISGYSLVQRWLLTPQIYSLVHHFYLINNQERDQQYQSRLYNWNQHADLPLMSFLEVNTNFWASDISSISDRGSFYEGGKSAFKEAIQALQQIPTHFAPTKKLHSAVTCWSLVRELFSQKIKKGSAGADEMFPAFLFVVVRANISHLGAEINLIEDLLDPLLSNGSLGYMLVSLKACYEQILTEKREPARRKINMLI